jgi:hypothetical protein
VFQIPDIINKNKDFTGMGMGFNQQSGGSRFRFSQIECWQVNESE